MNDQAKMGSTWADSSQQASNVASPPKYNELGQEWEPCVWRSKVTNERIYKPDPMSGSERQTVWLDGYHKGRGAKLAWTGLTFEEATEIAASIYVELDDSELMELCAAIESAILEKNA